MTKLMTVVNSKGEYVEYVLCHIQGAVCTVQDYSITSTDILVDCPPPSMRIYKDDEGFILPIFNGELWTEGATAQEIMQWEQEHPAPEVIPMPPTDIEVLQQENTLLKAQVGALSSQNDFHEELIVELANQVYA